MIATSPDARWCRPKYMPPDPDEHPFFVGLPCCGKVRWTEHTLEDGTILMECSHFYGSGCGAVIVLEDFIRGIAVPWSE